MNLLLRWLLNALALWITVELLPGITINPATVGNILFTALILGLVNALVRPVLIILSLPFTILTLGLFLLVVNALALGVVAALTPLNLAGFGSAIIGALALSIISGVLSSLLGDKAKR
jgi:putative membrane protein